MHRVDDRAGVPQWAAPPRAIFTARPTSVDEPTVDIMLRHALGKHAGVTPRVKDNERGTVAR